jgi:uncharacterized protein YuzE
MGEKAIKEIMDIVPNVMQIQSKHIFIDYDRAADVLYISLEKPQKATDSELLKNNVLIRRKNNKIIGLTIMNASIFRR